ncbi:DUF4430 domain-containing protein [Granulicatella seriolae]|uniref:DUF4430 domain-containing protein n=1 Tax=Granulicatella seriolae TaxID=2967226 RepID=A0ABT1WNS8_9LACT|nr:DUF4430 domain-containing protein [Granulicatella seriolae]
MKKILAIILSFMTVLLVACQAESAKTDSVSSTEVVKVSVQILIQGEEVAGLKKEVEVPKEQSLMDLMKNNYTIEETGGLIETINDIKADSGDHKGRYWKLLVNQKMSQVGAGEVLVKDGDQVQFDLTDDWSN